MDAVDVIGLRLSAQRALLGAVGDGLYGACVDVRNGTVVVTWYIARGISGDERESLEVAGTEIIADFPSDVGLDEQFIEVRDTSAPLPTVGTWVFLRRGFRTITAHRMEDAGDRLDTSVYSGHEPVDIRACRGPRPHSVFREHAIPEGLFVRAATWRAPTSFICSRPSISTGRMNSARSRHGRWLTRRGLSGPC